MKFFLFLLLLFLAINASADFPFTISSKWGEPQKIKKTIKHAEFEFAENNIILHMLTDAERDQNGILVEWDYRFDVDTVNYQLKYLGGDFDAASKHGTKNYSVTTIIHNYSVYYQSKFSGTEVKPIYSHKISLRADDSKVLNIGKSHSKIFYLEVEGTLFILQKKYGELKLIQFDANGYSKERVFSNSQLTGRDFEISSIVELKDNSSKFLRLCLLIKYRSGEAANLGVLHLVIDLNTFTPYLMEFDLTPFVLKGDRKKQITGHLMYVDEKFNGINNIAFFYDTEIVKIYVLKGNPAAGTMTTTYAEIDYVYSPMLILRSEAGKFESKHQIRMSEEKPTVFFMSEFKSGILFFTQSYSSISSEVGGGGTDDRENSALLTIGFYDSTGNVHSTELEIAGIDTSFGCGVTENSLSNKDEFRAWVVIYDNSKPKVKKAVIGEIIIR